MIEFVSYIADDDNRPKPERDYYERFWTLQRTVKAFGYETKLLRGNGTPIFINRLQALKRYIKKINHPVVMIDADCFLLDRIDEVFDADFDIGVVYRGLWVNEDRHDDVTGGVVFFKGRNRKKEIQFIDNWINLCKKYVTKDDWWYDQKALNELVGKPDCQRSYLEYYNGISFETEVKNGIAFFDALKYSCPFILTQTYKAKIVHYCHIILSKKHKMFELGEEE